METPTKNLRWFPGHSLGVDQSVAPRSDDQGTSEACVLLLLAYATTRYISN